MPWLTEQKHLGSCDATSLAPIHVCPYWLALLEHRRERSELLPTYRIPPPHTSPGKGHLAMRAGELPTVTRGDKEMSWLEST